MPGFEPRPHWWEASALTSGPSLAPHKEIIILASKLRLSVKLLKQERITDTNM